MDDDDDESGSAELIVSKNPTKKSDDDTDIKYIKARESFQCNNSRTGNSSLFSWSKTLTTRSRLMVEQIEDNEKCHKCGLCSASREQCISFITLVVVIGALLYAIISIATPIAGLYAGRHLKRIFNEYSET